LLPRGPEEDVALVNRAVESERLVLHGLDVEALELVDLLVEYVLGLLEPHRLVYVNFKLAFLLQFVFLEGFECFVRNVQLLLVPR